MSMILKDHGLLISEGQTDVQTLVILELLLCLKSIHVSSKMEVIRLVIREVIIRKKKVVNFHNFGPDPPSPTPQPVVKIHIFFNESFPYLLGYFNIT